MINNEILTLTIDSKSFSALKKDFDKVLKKTLGNMLSKESVEATMTLKLGIKLTEVEVPDFDSALPNATKKIHKPRFDHKVSSVMQIKTEESGSLKGEYELVWDDDAQEFVMRPIDDGQRTFFDDDIVDDCPEFVDCDEFCEDEVPALPSGKALLEEHNEEGNEEK